MSASHPRNCFVAVASRGVGFEVTKGLLIVAARKAIMRFSLDLHSPYPLILLPSNPNRLPQISRLI
ncbi:MAG: hypothetical protein F6K00_03490 [Leptolyngbya sp. SIOISBB]|nr:hypothetical protein [Leptolyngbya sp. SIOISBB]